MAKIFLFSTILFIVFVSCHKDISVEPFNYERDTPAWLKVKIDSMSTNQYYTGTIVYRYEWNKELVYHIKIPLSSCAYCELFDHNGNRIQLTEETGFDFQENRSNEIIIWEWKD